MYVLVVPPANISPLLALTGRRVPRSFPACPSLLPPNISTSKDHLTLHHVPSPCLFPSAELLPRHPPPCPRRLELYRRSVIPWLADPISVQLASTACSSNTTTTTSLSRGPRLPVQRATVRFGPSTSTSGRRRTRQATYLASPTSQTPLLSFCLPALMRPRPDTTHDWQPAPAAPLPTVPSLAPSPQTGRYACLQGSLHTHLVDLWTTLRV